MPPDRRSLNIGAVSRRGLAPKTRAKTVIFGTGLTEETAERFSLTDPSIQQERIRGVPMQRLGRPEDVADAGACGTSFRNPWPKGAGFGGGVDRPDAVACVVTGTLLPEDAVRLAFGWRISIGPL